MNIRIFSPVAVAAIMTGALVSACHDDDGNYTYTTLDTVDIVQDEDDPYTEGYILDRGERLTINPVVRYNGQVVNDGDDVPLSYMWTFYSKGTGAGEDYTIDTLATTKALDVAITRIGGDYTAQLTVTNTITGVESYFLASCKVEETITSGWMILYERADQPGTSDAGLLANRMNTNGIVNPKEFWNLYSTYNGGEPLPGKPVRILHEAMPLPTGQPRLVTEKTIVTVSPTTFEKVLDCNEHFFEAPENETIRYFGTTVKANAYNEAILTNDNTYRILAGSSWGGATGMFGVPKNTEGVGRLAAWGSQMCMGSSMWGGIESVVYDLDAGAFYYTAGTLDFYTFGAQDMDICQFDVNNTEGAELLFGDWGKDYHDFMMFRTSDGKYYVAEANFTQNGSLPSIGLTWADVSDAPEISDIKTFATNLIGRYAYYGAGSTLRKIAYDKNQGDNTRYETIWTAPDPNEQVVCVRTNKFQYVTLSALMYNANKVVHIATWNPVTNSGKLYQYLINPASGKITSSEQSTEYTVPGKVKDMCWKYELPR